MLTRLGDARTTVARSLGRSPLGPVRTKTSTADAKLTAKGALAKDLEKTGVWKVGRLRKNHGRNAIDPRRVNIVSESLCDDIVKYIGPSLERHRGCDLIDLNPGAGLWSNKLHEFLEPRKHVMMDIDAALYKPFLKPLLKKKNVELVPRAGIVWKDLFEMLHTRLANQLPLANGAEPHRNDTLLVTANLSTFPKKSYQGFESISTMVIYQFMASIRASSLFQRYGLVRMLLWVNDEDKRRLLPRSITRRKRTAFEAELSCEWIHEVVGADAEFDDRHGLRDEWINREGGYDTAARMKASGLEMPTNRMTRTFKEVLADPSLQGVKLAGARPPVFLRPFKQEMHDLESEPQDDDDDVDTTANRLKYLRTRDRIANEASLVYLDLLQQFDTLRLAKSASPEAFAAANAALNHRIDHMKKNPRNEFINLKDSYHLFRQSTPALLWDRREYEPLVAQADEFYPNAPTALLDIQPKTMNPLFREHGPSSTRSGDMSDTMLRTWFASTLMPIPNAMEALWSGFGAMAGECPSWTDPARGGLQGDGWAELTGRMVNEEQWAEIMGAWMRWPFRPSYEQMLGRAMSEEEDGEDDSTRSGAGGVL